LTTGQKPFGVPGRSRLKMSNLDCRDFLAISLASRFGVPFASS
jgi:hypothetical protein